MESKKYYYFEQFYLKMQKKASILEKKLRK